MHNHTRNKVRVRLLGRIFGVLCKNELTQRNMRQLVQAKVEKQQVTRQQRNQAMSTAEILAIQKDIATMKEDYNESLDTIWMLLAGMLVFFMHAGFSLLESGCVREKNAQNILAKNLIVVTVGFLCWYVIGWPLAYGVTDGDPNKFMGFTQFFHANFWDSKELFRNWFFQGAFCATACTIVSGEIGRAHV